MLNKIVIASDSFKGSVSSGQVASSCEKAIKAVIPSCEVIKVSIADGGEGTLESLSGSIGAFPVRTCVQDPLGRPIYAEYAIAGDSAIIEMSKASGLPLLDEKERNPMYTSTFGTGELILDALDKGCRRFLVGIGGSATNDGGMGMMSALGARFLDMGGNVLEGIGANLDKVKTIDLSGLDPRIKDCSITVACDVDTPFCGTAGAAYVFAPQKGANPKDVETLDKGLENLCSVILHTTGKNIRDIPGSGAAGGLGGAFLGILGAKLTRGIDMILEATGFDKAIDGADLVITGEGKMDFQTPKGKTASGVVSRARQKGIPVLAVAGKVENCEQIEMMGFQAILEISRGIPTQQAMDPAIAMANIERCLKDYLESL